MSRVLVLHRYLYAKAWAGLFRSDDADRRNSDPYFFFNPQNSLDIRSQQIELGQQFVVGIDVIPIDENIGKMICTLSRITRAVRGEAYRPMKAVVAVDPPR